MASSLPRSSSLVSSINIFCSPVNDLLRGNSGLLLFLPFILLWPLHISQQKNPLNCLPRPLHRLAQPDANYNGPSRSWKVFLGFLSAFANSNGWGSFLHGGRIVLEALILISAMVCALTSYTFWASKKGTYFSFLVPILYTSLIILVLTGFMQAFFLFGFTAVAVYGAIGAIIFSGYIVFDTDNLIKRFTYDEYIWASITLFLDILNLFLSILRILGQRDG